MRSRLPALVAILALVGGCGWGGSDHAGAGAPPTAPTPSSASSSTPSSTPSATVTAPDRIERYVALGDSYTGAPGIPGRSSTDGCQRSSANYPHLLARRLGVARLVDVSCGGATTADLTGHQPVRDRALPPQLRALTPDTDLVTLGIGGNDLATFGTMITACVQPHAASLPGSPCTARLRPTLPDRLSRIERNVTRAIRAVRRAAPAARVVVVGYPQLFPTSGTCRDLPFAPGDVPFAHAATAAMTEAVHRAAVATDVDYLDLLDASRGHDICSDDPWVNGFSGPGAAPFHPFPAEQAHVASALAGLLAGT